MADLGVLLSTDLSQEAQINYVLNRPNRILGFVNRSPSPQVHTLLPRQASVGVFDGCPFKLVMSGLFNKFVRIVRVGHGFHYREIASDMGLVSLEGRRQIQDAIFLYKLLNALIDSPQLLERMTALNLEHHTVASVTPQSIVKEARQNKYIKI
ncbi:hypothetical protein J6590_087364 [Homalodisca vitripennis]|nr:hypothetical protein J6590_087364 [Homalodisca vitripennis]